MPWAILQRLGRWEQTILDRAGSRRVSAVLGVSLLTVAAAAAIPASSPTNDLPAALTSFTNVAWYSRAQQSDEGLPGNTVVGVGQTLDGYLWVATESGLVRSDGLHFQEVARSASATPPGSRTMAFLVDGRGRIWLGKRTSTADGAVVCVEAGRIRVFTKEDGVPQMPVIGMAEDGEGAVWATGPGFVCRIHEGRIRSFVSGKDLPGAGDCHLTSDGRGQLWFAQDNRVGVYREGAFRTLLSLPEGNPVLSLAGARSGGVWVAAGRRVLRYTGEGEPQDLGEFGAGRPDLPGAVLLEDRVGRLWVGTARAGLFLYNGSGFDAVASVRHEILNLADDREGNLWVGTRGGGLLRVRPRAFELQDLSSGPSREGPLSLCQDAGGTLWAVTQNGRLARREGQLWHLLSTVDGWPDLPASCVAAAAGGGIWVGTSDRGLFCWREGTLRPVTTQDGLAGKWVTALLPTPSGELWIGTLGSNAVQRLRGAEFRSWMLPQIYGPYGCLAMDAQGQAWAATEGGLLAEVSRDGLVDMTTNTLGILYPINSLYATPDGSLWIGYAGCGVGRLKDGRFTRFGTEHGLLDDNITHILADAQNRMWFAANRGLFRVAQSELEAVADGRQTRVHSTSYGREDGMPALESAKGRWPGALRAADGRLCIPMVSGLLVVEPALLGRNRQPPPVVIERVVADGRTVAAYQPGEALPTSGTPPPLELGGHTTRLRLGAGLRQLELEYAGLSYVSPRNVEFKFRLQGLDREWVAAGSRRVAYYSHLPPGDYQFQVIACNNDGVWSSEGAALAIQVLPHFWQTGWFMAACFAGGTVALIGTGWGIARRRARRRLAQMAQAHALEQERTRIARDMHDELGSRLTAIANLGELSMSHSPCPADMKSPLGSLIDRVRELISD